MFDIEVNKKLSNREFLDVYRINQTKRKHQGVRIRVAKNKYLRTNQPRVYKQLINKLNDIEIDTSENFYLSNYRAALSYFRDRYELVPVQVEFLVWARGYKYFTIEQAKVLFLIGNNLKPMIKKLIDLGFLEIKFYGHKKKRIPYKYGLSSNGKRIAYQFYNMIEKGEVPENY